MSHRVDAWNLIEQGKPMVRATRSIDAGALLGDQALVEVAGCGVCHTDLGFSYDGVRTRHALPLTLGHEISGRVVDAGPDAKGLVGRAVVVPAVLPCGTCDACAAGRGAICKAQVFPGNDDHGGFASHVVVPGRGLCPVDEARLVAAGVALSTMSVIADAVSTPYQALVNANLVAGDLAVFIGVGGVGSFGVQLAAAMGAVVVAIDVDRDRLERARGASSRLDAKAEPRAIKEQIRSFAKQEGLSSTGWKIFETSGHPAGQELAFSLLGPDGHLGVVGFTRDKVTIRLSNLMAFDATARGTWGCLPEHYPAIVDRVLAGDVELGPFVEEHPMSRINEIFEALHRREMKLRPVLVPDFNRGDP